MNSWEWKGTSRVAGSPSGMGPLRGWQPDPSWPAPPEGWPWWHPVLHPHSAATWVSPDAELNQWLAGQHGAAPPLSHGY